MFWWVWLALMVQMHAVVVEIYEGALSSLILLKFAVTFTSYTIMPAGV